MRVDVVRRNGGVEFSVADNGIGIPQEDHAHVLDKFYQVDKIAVGIGEGTGLGLAITKRLVEQHGGRILVSSQPDAGSRFYFTIPLASENRRGSTGVLSATK